MLSRIGFTVVSIFFLSMFKTGIVDTRKNLNGKVLMNTSNLCYEQMLEKITLLAGENCNFYICKQEKTNVRKPFGSFVSLFSGMLALMKCLYAIGYPFCCCFP